ncbi:MAG: Verru_Chthon cassette protein D [Roseimicrobium sp.]
MPRHRKSGAFTLVEILVVVTIMGLMLAMVGLTVPGSIASQKLAGTARQVAGELDHAAMVAQRDNKPVEVRFYRCTEAGIGGASEAKEYRAYQVATITGWSADGKPKVTFTGEPQRLPEGIVFTPNPSHTTLLTKAPLQPGPDDAEIGEPYEYISYVIRPDGGTTLPRPEKTVLTLVHERQLSAEGTLPADYRSLVVNPYNGQVTLY